MIENETSLWESACTNKNLRYIDAETLESSTLQDLPFFNLPDEGVKTLAFLYLDNSILSVACLWSFWKHNCAIVLLDKDVHASLKDNLEETYLPNFIYDPSREGVEGYEKLRTASQFVFKKAVSHHYPIAAETKLLLSTSGTTGSPKLVKLSESNVVRNALSIADYLPINNSEVTPLNLPLYYSYGFSLFSSNSISGGDVVCTTKTIFDKEFWIDFEKHGYTTLAGVPYVYEMLNRIGFTKKEYPSLKYITQAGGKLNEKTLGQFHEYCQSKGVEFFTMYGQTEATARISYVPPSMLAEKIGSIGIPIKDGKFSMDQETSELLYQGPNIFGGYATTIEDLATYDSPAILATGDIGTVDDDGFYFIKGRIKRFVKLFGKRINLDDIENACKIQYPQRAFGVTAKEDNKVVIAYDGEDLPKNEIRKFIKEKYSIHPSYVIEEHKESMPLTSNGKINYKALLS